MNQRLEPDTDVIASRRAILDRAEADEAEARALREEFRRLPG